MCEYMCHLLLSIIRSFSLLFVSRFILYYLTTVAPSVCRDCFTGDRTKRLQRKHLIYKFSYFNKLAINISKNVHKRFKRNWTKRKVQQPFIASFVHKDKIRPFVHYYLPTWSEFQGYRETFQIFWIKSSSITHQTEPVYFIKMFQKIACARENV